MQENERTTRLDWFWMLAIACGAIYVRLYPHAWNVTPVGALALFAGCRFRTRIALFIPLVVMVVSDSVLWWMKDYLPFNPWVYVGFSIYVLAGHLFVKPNSPVRIGVTAVACLVLFFLLTNFGAWLSPIHGYPKTWAGLVECYTRAIAFIRAYGGGVTMMFVGELVYCGLVFGGYALVRHFGASRVEAPNA